MEELTEAKQAILDVIDVELEKINKRLRKYEPLIAERNKLQQTRRTLLDERSSTGGGGRNGARLTMESVIHYLRENGASTPQDVADAVGVPAASVRSHFNRHKNERYASDEPGIWRLIEDEDDDE